jgi:3-dehydroquinate dehydratase-1
VTRARAIGGVALGGRPRIVASGGEADLDALAAAEGADLVEVRADLFADPEPVRLAAALARLRSAGRPIVLTVRAAAEGGRALPDARRAELYAAGLAHVDAIDVEIASAALVADLVPRARAAGRTVILSAHFLDAPPPTARLLALVDRAEGLGADLTKLAAHARNLEDVCTLLEATLAARARGVVTLAMGPVGAISRLCFPAAGSQLTYASVGAPTAPGQLPLGELVRLVRRFYPPSPVTAT